MRTVILARTYQRNSEDLTRNLFGTYLVKLCISQVLIICSGIIKWPNSNQMTCIHALGSNVMGYVIFDIPVSNKIVNFDVLNGHDHEFDHRHLTLTLNISMHNGDMQENCQSQRHLVFYKSKMDLFLMDLIRGSHLLNYTDNIKNIYHNFTTTLSTSISKFSTEVSCKKSNRTINPWYDNDCKAIHDAPNETLKLDMINMYKDITKRKKGNYIKRKQEKLLQLSKYDHGKFWREILTYKTKENNLIPLKNWNS